MIRSPLYVGLLLVAVSACSDEPAAPNPLGSVDILLDVTEAQAAGYAIDNAVVTLEHVESSEVVTREVAVGGGQAVVEVDLRPGTWSILVELYEGTVLVGTGTGTAVVLEGYVTDVELQIDLAVGGLTLHIEWSDEGLGTIADLGADPVTVEISGVGTYTVGGLSRIGWDIEVESTPISDTQVSNSPGDVTFPDIVMLALTSTLSEVNALAAWIDGPPDPRSALVTDFHGRGGETAEVSLFEVVPVQSNTNIEAASEPDMHTLAGVRVAFATLQLSSHTPDPTYPPCPKPGHTVEISGVGSGDPEYCYGDGVLDVPAVGSSGPLHMPSLRDAQPAFDWAEEVRQDVENLGCVGCGAAIRRSYSVITFDGTPAETGRINLYEGWPSRFSLFDPDQAYGQSYLFSMTVTAELIEEAL